MANRLDHIVVSLEDIPLEQILGKWFTVHEKTIGLAESCTGGNIAHHITQVVGASHYFNGSIVCYQKEIKEKILFVKKETLDTYGVVSEQTAIEMAQGARKVLGADYGFGVTGLLSAGGDDDRVPVGTIWMAVADKDVVKTKEHRFFSDRERNKELATSMGMLLIWKFINGKL